MDDVVKSLRQRPITLAFGDTNGHLTYSKTFEKEYGNLGIRLTDRNKYLNNELARLSREQLQCKKGTLEYKQLKAMVHELDEKISMSRKPRAQTKYEIKNDNIAT